MTPEAKVCALLQAECSASHGPLTVTKPFAVPGAPGVSAPSRGWLPPPTQIPWP